MFQDEFPDDVMAPVEKPEDPDEQLKKYLKTLPLNERRAYLASLRGQEPARQQAIPQGVNMNDQGDSQAFGAYMYANAMHGMQGRQLQGMANTAMGAIAQENARRVAIAREMRRMQHEQELERMKQETEQMKINALISRLQQQQGGGGGWSNPAEGLFFR